MLAATSDALVVGFNVRPNAEARALADREGVDIRTYRVIYQLTEDIEQALVGMLSAVTTEETLGEAEVRALFKVSRLGTIAGCMVTTGVARRNAQVRVVRDGTVIYETTIAQLRRFKDDVREVAEGFECGILLDGFNDVKEGDVLEAYETREVERTEPRRARRPPAFSLRRATPLDRPVRSDARGVRLRRHPHRRAALSRGALAEGEAHVRALGEAAAAEPRRRLRREVDHHDVWQRARLTVACVARQASEAERLLDEAERWLNGQAWGRWRASSACSSTPSTTADLIRRGRPQCEPPCADPEAGVMSEATTRSAPAKSTPQTAVQRLPGRAGAPDRRPAVGGSARGSAASPGSRTSAATTPCEYQEKYAVGRRPSGRARSP